MNRSSIKETHPDLLEEWHPEKNGGIEPSDISSGSVKKIWWLGKCGHEWSASPNNRIRGKNITGCPYCSGQKVLRGFNDLLTKSPEIASEWNIQKNKGVKPNEIYYRSNKKAWWIGKCGHEWDTEVYKRITGQGCPYCSNHRLLAGYNDFYSIHPDISKEWDYELNNNLKPSEVFYSSKKKVWWKCSKGHSWKTSIATRHSGSGCPYCSKKAILKNFNDLATLSPSLAKEWHPTKNDPITPDSVSANDSKKYWWLGKCGHEWMASISNRYGNKSGCPYCSGKKILIGFNDLNTTHPELVEEWHPTKNKGIHPSDITYGSHQKIWWLGKCGHEWESNLHDRTRGIGCPYCSNRYLLQGYNDLATTHPKIAAEWHPTKNSLSPTEVQAGTNKQIWWQGKCGHEWQASILYRTRQKLGCPICSSEYQTSFPEQAIYYFIKKNISETQNRFLIDGKYEVDIFLPSFDICIEYDGSYFHDGKSARKREIEKEEYLYSTGRKLYRIREISKRVKQDALPDSPKYECLTIDVTKGYNQLYEIIAKLFQILNIPPKNAPTFEDIEKETGNILDSYLTMIKEKSIGNNQTLLSSWSYKKNGSLNPYYISDNSHQKFWWSCDKGHEWQTSAHNRAAGYGCPYCSGNKVLLGFNDLQSCRPDLVIEWDYTKNTLIPQDVNVNSTKKFWWICQKCGYEWETVVYTRTKMGRGCPSCAKNRLIRGKNDLLTKNPPILQEWNYKKNGDFSPADITLSSQKKVWWLCKNGHEWKASPATRFRNGRFNMCPKCHLESMAIPYDIQAKRFAEKHPFIEIIPETYISGNQPATLLCKKCGNQWEEKPRKAYLRVHACKNCN